MALVIRPAMPTDASSIAEIYRPYVEESRISFEDVAPDAAEMVRRLNGDVQGLYPWLVAEDGDDILGYATSSAFRTRRAYRWYVETGIYLHREDCGRGIGRELLTALLDRLRQQGFVSAIG